MALAAPPVKRLVDLVSRAPADNFFFPTDSNDTIFRRQWSPHQNVVSEVVEVGYQGHATWGQRITVNLRQKETGDLLSWICLRLRPRSWLGPDLENRILSGKWGYQDPSSAWMWAASLGSIAIQEAVLEIGDSVIERVPGEWLDIWSRAWLDGSRAGTWDADIYGQIPPWEIRNVGRPAWTTVWPTEDGYVYCWLPLAFFVRPQLALPLVAIGDSTEVRLHITLRPFAEVVRRRAVPRTSVAEVPMGEAIVLVDRSGATPVPWEFVLPATEPDFEDATVMAGVVHTEDPLRSAYLHVPLELMYQPVTWMRFDVPPGLTAERPVGSPVLMTLPLRMLNGPLRELCFFLRRRAVWRYNEWTNYGALMEDELIAAGEQAPMLESARLMVGNAVIRPREDERWWRWEYGLTHRGGVRLSSGMVYGVVFGDAGGWTVENAQPAGTLNASRADLRLDLWIQPPVAVDDGCGDGGEDAMWEVVVFAVGINWLRFTAGQAAPLFKD